MTDTINIPRAELQAALDLLRFFKHGFLISSYTADRLKKVSETIEVQLAQQEEKPEPVAWQSRMRPDWEENGWLPWKDCTRQQANDYWEHPRRNDWIYEARALYTAPPKREWQGLTDDERKEIFESMPGGLEEFCRTWGWLPFTKAIEAKLKEKNG